MDLDPLFQAIRQSCSSGTWSRGIELARADAVDGVSSSDEQIVVRVKSPGLTVAPEVTLLPEYDEWTCVCDSNADCCEHVAAAIIALRAARKAGQPLPSSKKAGGRVGYRLSADGDRLVVDRVVGDTPLEVSLSGILSGREQGPAVEPTRVDLSIDRLLSDKRVRSFDVATAQQLAQLLAEADDVMLDGAPVRVEPQPLGPRAVVSDGPNGGYLLRLEPPAGVARVIAGLALVEKPEPTLRPLALVEITGPKLEKLPSESRYPLERAAELVSEVLPRLRAHGEVLLRAALPERVGKLAPRLIIQVEQRGAALCALPLVVYGDPPCARVDGDKLVHLGGPLPERDRRAEERAAEALRKTFDAVPGRRIDATGADAIALSRALKRWSGDISGSAHRDLYPDAPLTPALDDRLAPAFTAAGRSADPREVMRAFEAGLGVVSLAGGGWAEIPRDWLASHGDHVARLLAGQSGDALAPHARPALAALCDALEHPRPPELARPAPLVDGFAGVPHAPLPDDVTAELRDYQRRGVDWLSFLRAADLGGVLADDMGLGKTLQALCAIRGTTLVVCPRSVVHNWVAEIRRFRPELSHAVYHGQGRALEDVDVTLTTYALLRNDVEVLSAERWDAVILDESQAIKNPDSQVARAAYALEARFRLTMSGTPVENRLDELWSQMHFANRGLLGGREAFRDRFERPIQAGDAGAAARLRERIKPFILRRTKAQVAPELPPRSEAVLCCELDERERAIYQAVLLACRQEVIAELDAGGSVLAALEALLRLRQAACDVALLPGHARSEPSSKVERLLSALDEAVADGHKALVFSQWTSLLDRVEPELARAGIAHIRLDGQTRDRAGVVAAFQSEQGPPVMLLSLKAGGTGLNLTAADHVFLLDPWWNPAVEDQAADRAHRIGQDKPVMVYRLVAKDTVEEGILALQDRKRAIADAALAGGGAAAAITRDDLLALLA